MHKKKLIQIKYENLSSKFAQWSSLNFNAIVGLPYFWYCRKPEQSLTAIPLILGVILVICNGGVKKENKLIAHIAVLVTLIALLGLQCP